MAVTLSKILFAICRLFFLLVFGVIMATAFLELIVAPINTFKHLGPSMMHSSNTSKPSIVFFYVICILVQLANFVASVALLFTLLTRYHGTWFAFDTFGLLSVSASLSLVATRELTGIDYYRTVVEQNIYLQTAKVGDLRCNQMVCFYTDVHKWHH